MPDQYIIDKYEKVSSSLEKAIKASDNIDLVGDEENNELEYIRRTLDKLNDDFKTEINQLEKSTEWDRFCMAFFGETNAGKSTIIEALRIVYNEETRRNSINEQKRQLSEERSKENENYKELVDALTKLNVSLTPKRKYRLSFRTIIITSGLFIFGILCGLCLAYLIL